MYHTETCTETADEPEGHAGSSINTAAVSQYMVLAFSI
jgi:hypothetical protein